MCVSEMSFGALSEEARIALARAAELAHTDICSGESGMPAEEQAENSQHLYELASAQFSWNPALVETVQAFNFKGGQGAKTEAGRHFFEEKIAGEIAEVRCLTPGQDAISLANFVDLQTPSDFRNLATRGVSVLAVFPSFLNCPQTISNTISTLHWRLVLITLS